MPPPGQNTSLSLAARLTVYLGPPITILATSYASPKTGLLSPLAFIPTAWAYKQWRCENERKPSQRAELEPLIWTYLLSGTIGVALVSTLQAAVGYGICTLLYGNGEDRIQILKEIMRHSVSGLSAQDVQRRAAIASSWKYITLINLVFFLTAGLGEETLKLLPVFYARSRGTPEERKPRNRAYLDYVVSSSLAFGVVEGIGFLYSSCVTGKERGSKLALTVCERLVLGSSGHVLMAVLSALRAIRRDYYGDTYLAWWRVVGPSALIHGAFDVGALLFSASDGNPGWIHPTGVGKTVAMLLTAGGFWAGTAWMVWRELKLLAAHDGKASFEESSE